MTARLNVLATTLTLICALSLFFGRPQPNSYLLVDDLNGTFIALTTFVGFTTSVFSASYIGHELEIGRLTPASVRFYHAMYQVLMFAMNLALVANNIGLMWVAIELATLTTVLMVGIYRTHEALEAAWKYFHSRQRRHRARAVRHHSRLHGGAADRRRGPRRHGVDRARHPRERLRPGVARPGLRLFAARLRHQGRPRATACLAARRARRRPDADFGGAVGPAAQRRALRAAALQNAAGGERGRAGARPADGDARLAVARVRGLHALPPARHQAAVRLFVDRAHGHHHLCVRHGRPASPILPGSCT